MKNKMKLTLALIAGALMSSASAFAEGPEFKVDPVLAEDSFPTIGSSARSAA